MKRLLLIAMIVLSVRAASAKDVTLQWDANDPAPEGYRLFVRTTSEGTDSNYTTSYSHDRSYQATSSQVQLTVHNLVNGVEYAFVCRAYQGDIESGDSNEVIYRIPIMRRQNSIKAAGNEWRFGSSNKRWVLE